MESIPFIFHVQLLKNFRKNLLIRLSWERDIFCIVIYKIKWYNRLQYHRKERLSAVGRGIGTRITFSLIDIKKCFYYEKKENL